MSCGSILAPINLHRQWLPGGHKCFGRKLGDHLLLPDGEPWLMSNNTCARARVPCVSLRACEVLWAFGHLACKDRTRNGHLNRSM